QQLAEALEGIVPPQSAVAYLDYPLYRNVGDLMIYLATERWMIESGFQVLGRWHKDNFDYPELQAEVVILLQGGGNFGDLYGHEHFRERVVRRYPDNRIVFLPQTMHFTQPQLLDAALRVLNGHPDVHLLLRDHRSFERAASIFHHAACRLVPDMAVFLHPVREALAIANGRVGTARTIYLLRRDGERGASDDAIRIPDECWLGDWIELMGHHRISLGTWQAVGLLLRGTIAPAWFAERWCSATWKAVAYCAGKVSASRRMVTSRLHGHILASLLGVPSTLLDNSYGKNSTYFDTWHQGLKIAELRRAPG
ncbi:MAG: polysaccharide pyruvyl transferase family protein, partial [Chromatiales bacterium]